MPEEIERSNSEEQQSAEVVIRAKLSEDLNIQLKPYTELIAPSVKIQIDGYNKEKKVLCEIYARVGTVRGAQINKVRADMFQLMFHDKRLGGGWRKICAFRDREAAKQFLPSSSSWTARAAEMYGIEIRLVNVSDTVKNSVVSAQKRQRMVNE